MTVARRSIGVVAGSNDRLYVTGGYDGSTVIASVEEYDPASDTWMSKAPMPSNGSDHGSAALGNTIYVIGGSRPGEAILSDVLAYDITTDAWTSVASLPNARAAVSATTAGGEVYAIGGVTVPFSPFSCASDVTAYDPGTDTWSTKTPMSTPRCWAGVATAMNGKIYAVGGAEGSGGNSALSTVEEYDPATDTWVDRASMPTPRSGPGLVALPDGRLLAIGGGNASGALDVVESYDPATDTWATESPLLVPRQAHGAAAIAGSLYAVGGESNGIPMSSVEQASLDLTPPSIVASIAAGTLGDNGFYVSDVTITFDCTDTGSGIAAGACPPNESLTAEGIAISSTPRTVTDIAGNISAPSNVITVPIDKTPPTVVASIAAGTLGDNGFYVSDVTITFDCTDTGAGVFSCPPGQVLTAEGDSISSAAATATDKAGNVSAPSNTVTVKIDKTAPSRPSLSDPQGPITVPAATSYVVRGFAEPGSLVRVWRDDNLNFQHDAGEPMTGTQQLAPGISSYAVTTTLQPGFNNLVLTSTDPAGHESPSLAVPRINSAGAPASPDLAVTLKSQGLFRRGGTGQYLVTIVNKGTSPTSGAIVAEDTLPTALTFAGAFSSTGAPLPCGPLGGSPQVVQCTWPFGPIPPNTNVQFTIRVGISPSAPTTIDNSVAVITPDDPNAANNVSTDTAAVR